MGTIHYSSKPSPCDEQTEVHLLGIVLELVLVVEPRYGEGVGLPDYVGEGAGNLY